jgi:peptide/nickel transport system permease protein
MVALIGLSMPGFFVGMVLIIVFGVELGWLPVLGKGTSAFFWSRPSTWIPFWFKDWSYLIMPAFALGWYFSGAMLRITRSGMLDVLGSDYIKLVRLKGVPERMVVAKHALKNSMIPVLTFAGLNLLIMVNVAVVIEVIFNWPGVGQLLYDGLSNRDFPMVQGVVLMSGLMIVVLNFTIDVLYGYVDPRIRLSR